MPQYQPTAEPPPKQVSKTKALKFPVKESSKTEEKIRPAQQPVQETPPPTALPEKAKQAESKKNIVYRDGISEQVKDIVKKFSFNRPREYTIKSKVKKNR